VPLYINSAIPIISSLNAVIVIIYKQTLIRYIAPKGNISV